MEDVAFAMFAAGAVANRVSVIDEFVTSFHSR
jgi:hypothetical protein